MFFFFLLFFFDLLSSRSRLSLLSSPINQSRWVVCNYFLFKKNGRMISIVSKKHEAIPLFSQRGHDASQGQRRPPQRPGVGRLAAPGAVAPADDGAPALQEEGASSFSSCSLARCCRLARALSGLELEVGADAGGADCLRERSRFFCLLLRKKG